MEDKILFWIDELERVAKGMYVPPVCCEIDPSSVCMLGCSFCFYKGVLPEKSKFMDMGVYRRLVGSLAREGVKAITFTGGGEPLTHPEFQEMFDIAYEFGFEVGLVTNGVLLSQVKRLSRFKFIRVSLDAGTAETYRKIKKKDMFNLVVFNIKEALKEQKTVGISFVVCEENKNEIRIASDLSEQIGASYIQFKPMLSGNFSFDVVDRETETRDNVIFTDRYPATNHLPCWVAHLIGIVTSDGKTYFCCQKRGVRDMETGDLTNEDFGSAWRRRLYMTDKVDPSKCPRCRYMSYVRAYQRFKQRKSIMVEHKNFL